MPRDIPDKSECIVRYLLERNAAEAPQAVWLSFESGAVWTRRDGVEAMYRAGNRLREAGIERGDRVVLLVPNGEGFVRGLLGCCAIGAVAVPVNLAYHGDMMRRVYDVTHPAVAVADPQFAANLVDVAHDIAMLDPEDLKGGSPAAPELAEPLELYDAHAILMTSGTTGLSKGAVRTNLQLYCHMQGNGADLGLTSEDVWLIDTPLFHSGAMVLLASTLATRSRAAIRSRPDLRNYWRVAREAGATACLGISSMVTLLNSLPPSEEDRNHSIRIMICAPLPDDAERFAERFGIESLVTVWGMSEGGFTALFPGTPMRRKTCGVARPGVTIMIADEHDLPLPAGRAGQALVRHEWPWAISPEYVGDPAATAAAWRNGWFHTGDVLRADEDGYFYFEDRVKDMVRRRGENVSSFEVEASVGHFPGVAEAACVAAPDPRFGGDEVKVFVVPAEGCVIDPERLFLFCAKKMPYFMVPRFIEVVVELPKTPTAKVMKHMLRQRGNGAATWDCEDAGYAIKRDGVVRTETQEYRALRE